MAIYNNRVCRTCGKTFSGGPRAWFCPECRALRKKEQKARYNKEGFERHLGDKDVCQNCGKLYIIKSGLQKYCPECMPAMHKELGAQQSLRYYYDVVDKMVRSAKRRERYRLNKDEYNRKRREEYARKKQQDK